MPSPDAPCRLQRLFIAAAADTLPENPEVTWNKYGTMTYYWPSPCERMGGLWLNVRDYEIMLSTRLSHTHVDEYEYEVRNAQTGDVDERIVAQGIAEALSILRGETVFVKLFDSEGNEDSSSGMSPRHLWDAPEHRAKWTEFHGPDWTARAWDWQGEVTTWSDSIS